MPSVIITLTAPSAFLDQVRGAWGGTAAGTASSPAAVPPLLCRIHVTARSHSRRPAAVARSPTPPVEGAHHEARQKGILNPGGGEGTWGTTGGREQVWGQGLGRLQTILPWFPLTPNLACTNEETPRGESPEATRPDTRGHTARFQTPYGEIPRTRSRTEPRPRSRTPAL